MRTRFKLVLLSVILFMCLTSCLFDNDNSNSKYIYKIEKDIHRIKKYEGFDVEEMVEKTLNNNLGYYMHMGVQDNYLDENQIFVIQYPFGDYSTPVGCSETSFGFYDRYMANGDTINYSGFINNVNWLIDDMNEDNYLVYGFAWTHANVIEYEPGWISGMAQGEALAAFSMAYYLTNDEKYLQAANKTFKTLTSNTEDNWCIYVDESDYYWIEEYPNDDFCHVLNGYLFGMWGLWDYYVITDDELALDLFQASLKSVIDNWEIWDCDGEEGSRYCKHRDCVDIHYHPVHVNQLTLYAEYFGIQEFYDIIEGFNN